MECIYLETCPFFAGTLGNMPSFTETLKQKYCYGDFEKCARHILRGTMSPGQIPDNLFPHQVERVNLILKDMDG